MSAAPGGVEVGRVSLRVVPDTSHLGADLKVALDRIEAQTDLQISTSIDTTLLDEQARAAVEQAQLAAGDLDIKTNVDTSQVREAETALGSASGAAQGFSGSLGALATAAIVLGPALIPLVAVIAGLGAALVAPLAIAGGGLTVFGFLAGFAVSETRKQLKQIDQLKTKLAGLTKGTQAYADTAAQLRNAQAALTPAQTAFATALDGLKQSFDSIPKSIILAPITAGLNLLARILPLLTPVIKAVSGALTSMIGDLDKAAKSEGFKSFIDAFAKKLGPDLRAFATIAGNVFRGLFGLFGAFGAQLSGSVLHSLENLTGAFATWGQTLGQSKGFKSFVDYLRRVGPIVATALGGIAAGATAIVVAFAPVGTTVLAIVGQLGHAIAQVPTQVLVTLATAVVALVAGAKLLGPLAGVIQAVVAAPEVAIAVVAIAALTVGFIALYQRSKPLRTILGDLADFFKTELLPRIQVAAQQVIPALKSALEDVNQTLKDNKPFLETLGKVLLSVTTAAIIGGILALAANIRIAGKAFAIAVPAAKLWADTQLIALRVLTAGFTIFVTFVLGVFGRIVDGAASAFGWIPGIGDKIKGAQKAFHTFADGAIANLTRTGDRLKALQDQIDGIHGKTFTVTAKYLDAVHALELLQAFRIKDKSFKVTENVIERAVGPGGGIGLPSNNDGTVVPRNVRRPASSSTDVAPSSSPRSAPLVNIENMQTSDTADILRKSQRLARGRAGGGVVLAGSN